MTNSQIPLYDEISGRWRQAFGEVVNQERTRLPYLDSEIHAFAKRLGRYSFGKSYDAFLSHASEDK